MEFFDKKQEVIDVELTSFGKQLLSRGLFKPVYYAFSDDGVTYDSKWMTGSILNESQSSVEPRIQEETPRLKTQYRKTGAEKAHFAGGNSSYGDNLISIYESWVDVILDTNLGLYESFAESEKLLENILGTKPVLNNYNPAWNLLSYHGEFSPSLTTKYYTNKGVTVPNIPQIFCTLTDRAYRLPEEFALSPLQKVTEAQNIVSMFKDYPNAPFSSLFFENWIVEGEWTFMNTGYWEIVEGTAGSIFNIKDFLFLSLEELNSDFTNDNFTIEVFEVTNLGLEDEELTKLYFADESGVKTTTPLPHPNEMVEDIFDIKIDGEIDSGIACVLINNKKSLKKKSIYNSEIYDCGDGIASDKKTVSQNPYDSLPDVDIGEVC